MQSTNPLVIFVVSMIAFQLKLCITSSSTSTSCQRGWTKYHNKCFYAITRYMTFSQAIDTCNKMKASLAMIGSMDEQVFIEDHFMEDLEEKEPNSIWIGLMRFDSNKMTSDSFRWMNGSPVNFSFWHSVEPNFNGGIQFCVALWGGPDQTGSWFDAKCDKKYLALCQKPLTGLPVLSMDKPKARTFDFAIKQQYQLLDNAYYALSTNNVKIVILGVVNVVLGLILAAMIYFGDFSGSSITCLFPGRGWRSQENRGLVNQNYNPNNLNAIINQESIVPENFSLENDQQAKREGDPNGNL